MRPLLIIVVAAVLAVPRAEASYQGVLSQSLAYKFTVTNDGGNSDALGLTVLQFSKRSKIVSAQVLTLAKGETRQFDLTFKKSIVRVAFVFDAPPATPNTQVSFTLTQGIITVYNSNNIYGDTRLTWDVGP